MVDVKNAKAISEVLHYLKGIRQIDIDKLPKGLLNFLEENASKDYICDFDYTKPLSELDLLDETKGMLGLICINYWCETEEEKAEFKKKLNANEIQYQKELRERYNPDNIFKNDTKVEVQISDSANLPSKIQKEGIFVKIIKWFKNHMNKK